MWIALHHEPEGDGNHPDWVAMQRHLSPVFRQHDNIAFTIILMGWHQFPVQQYRLQHGQLLARQRTRGRPGFDPYNFYATTRSNGIHELGLGRNVQVLRRHHQMAEEQRQPGRAVGHRRNRIQRHRRLHPPQLRRPQRKNRQHRRHRSRLADPRLRRYASRRRSRLATSASPAPSTTNPGTGPGPSPATPNAPPTPTSSPAAPTSPTPRAARTSPPP